MFLTQMLGSDAYFLFSRTDLFQKVLYFPTSEMLSVAKLSIIKPKIRPRPQHLTQNSDIAFSATKASWRILRRATRRTMPGILPCLLLQTNNHLGPVSLFQIDKPESKSQSKVQAPNPKREFILWAVSKISWATTLPTPPHLQLLSMKDMKEVSNNKTQKVKVTQYDPLNPLSTKNQVDSKRNHMGVVQHVPGEHYQRMFLRV